MVTVFGDSNLMLENMQQTAMEADFMSLEIDSSIEMGKYMTAYESLEFLRDSGVKVLEGSFIDAIKNFFKKIAGMFRALIEKIKRWWKNFWKNGRSKSSSDNSKPSSEKSDKSDSNSTSSNSQSSTAKTEKEKKAKENTQEKKEKKEKAEEEYEKAKKEGTFDEKKRTKEMVEKAKKDYEDAKRYEESIMSKAVSYTTNASEEKKAEYIVYPKLLQHATNFHVFAKNFLTGYEMAFEKAYDNVKDGVDMITRVNATFNELRDKYITNGLFLGSKEDFADKLKSGSKRITMTPSEAYNYGAKLKEVLTKSLQPAVNALVAHLESEANLIEKNYNEVSKESKDENVKKYFANLLKISLNHYSKITSELVYGANTIKSLSMTPILGTFFEM